MNECRICGDQGKHPIFQAPERMFASQELFEYFRCLNCSCLQISEIPSDLSSYYPQHYYSYRLTPTQGWRAVLRRVRNQGLLRRSILGAVLNFIKPFDGLKAFAQVPVSRQTRILDLGCGQGQLVLALAELGFKQVYGMDSFLPQEISKKSPLISRGGLDQVKPGWDLIMLHHALEHLPDPHEVFQHVHQALNPEGYLLLRVPTVSSWAYEHYGNYWVQWDPPRHLYLFSRQNFVDLAQRYHFKMVFMQDDATSFQFLGSEAYQQGVPLADMKSPLLQRLRYQLKAHSLNRQGLGDQLICCLQKK